MSPTRRAPRRALAVLLTLCAAGGTAACGGSDDAEKVAQVETASPTPSATTAPSATPTATPAPAFPVSIEHAFGTAEIPSEPKRVVALGYQDQDPLLALGVRPIAVRYWFGDEDDAIYPWADDEAGDDSDIEILNMPDGVNIEKIAALKPDLIMGIYSDIDADNYPQLARIAPTVARPKEFIDYGTPWQVQTAMTGKAVGKADQAARLVADLETRFAQVRAEHPSFSGLQAAVTTYGDGSVLGTFASQDPRPRFFAQLGFTTPAAIDELAEDDSFYVEISKEKADLLDVDLLVWDQLSYTEGGRAAIEEDSVVAELAAMREKRSLFLEGDLENAFAFNSVLSLPYVLDNLVPLVTSALGGDTGAGPAAENPAAAAPAAPAAGAAEAPSADAGPGDSGGTDDAADAGAPPAPAELSGTDDGASAPAGPSTSAGEADGSPAGSRRQSGRSDGASGDE